MKCSRCAADAVEGKTKCKAHLEQAAEKARATRAARKARGKCIWCPRRAKAGHVLCSVCLKRAAETQRQRRNNHRPEA